MQNSDNELLDNALVIGITGGIASGKSELAKIISSKGYPVISTDDLAKELLNNSIELKSMLMKEFGSEIYTQDGKLISKILSEIVFNDTKKLQKLNSIVHPFVIDNMIESIESYVVVGNKIVFVESALIFEAGLEDGFDYIIVVTADDEIRIQRAMARQNISRGDVISRIKEQISQEEKVKLSDFNIENNKTLADFENSVNFILPIILALKPKKDYSSSEDLGE